MAALPAYRPFWPETTMFIGAGATAALGMPTTDRLGKFFRDLADAKTRDERRAKLFDDERAFLGDTQADLADLLDLLADDNADRPRLAELSPHQTNILDARYPHLKDPAQRREMVISLRRYYGWDALRRVILSTPRCENQGDFLRDLYNLLDLHIQTNSGLPVCGGLGASTSAETDTPWHTEGRFLQHESLRSARDCLVLLTNLLFACAYQQLLRRPRDYAPYVEATRSLARMMQKEGLGLARAFALNDRRFYLHSTAFLSMNFDPLFISLLLSANHEINHEGSVHVSANGLASPLKVALDLGHLSCVRADSKDPSNAIGMWYPFNESVAQRLNDPAHSTGRRVRLAKFHFPHGNSNTRLCPNCGKSFLHVGSGWTFPDPHLFPPSILKGLDWGYPPRTAHEEKWRDERGHYDALQCFHCGNRTGARDNFMVMQTSFKGGYTSSITDTHNEIRALLEGTRHIVLLGYSLPKDDVIWRAFLAARGNGSAESGKRPARHYCTVIVGRNGKFRSWLSGPELEAYLHDHADGDGGVEALKSAREVFGKDQVRAYVGGIPAVFSVAGEGEESLRQILYPDDWGPKFPRDWWSRRSES